MIPLPHLNFAGYVGLTIATSLLCYVPWRIFVEREPWKETLSLFGLAGVGILAEIFYFDKHISEYGVVVQVILLLIILRNGAKYRARTTTKREQILKERKKKRGTLGLAPFD